jgi:hypothetical protein
MSGFDRHSWRAVPAFSGRVAAAADVEQGAAVFALSDTRDPAVFEEPLPQPAIWYDEDADEDFAVLIVQAEQHTTEDGEVLQVLGLLMPDGRTAVGFTEDVEEVDGEDPDWLDLVDADLAGEDEEP